MKFKVGDRVEHDFYGMGTVIGVSNTDTPLVEFDNHFSGLHDGGCGEVNGIRGKDGHCWFTDMIKPLGTQTIVIYSKGLETIALLKEGHKVIKQASAKCNPSDTYDFNIGTKLAFSRLMGEQNPMVSNASSFDWEGFKQGKFAVHCDTKEKARQFLKECDEQGIKWCTNTEISDQKEMRWDIYKNNTSYGCNSFGGLMFGTFDNITKIDYTPSNTIREVKRPAKVGEWIKIVDADAWFDEYKNGDVFKVDELYISREEGIISSPHHIVPREYVVLENYQPKETIRPSLSMYTDKELINELSKRWEDRQ